MSCFSPNKMLCVTDSLTGEVKYKFEGSAKLDDITTYGDIDDLATKGSYRMLVPCGKCLGCQIDYSREWANRMCFELDDNPCAMFVTLTYRNDDLPRTDDGTATLSKRDIQLFFKRLRKAFPNKKIRYYLAGEYGPTTHRPHYHGIVYGLCCLDFQDLRQFGYNELKDPYYTSKRFESIWSHGFVMMSDVTYKTCAYVARYVLKKQLHRDDEMYQVQPEFNLSSRRPGIGLINARDRVLSGNSHFVLDGRDGVHEIILPKSMIRNVKRTSSGKDLDFISDMQYNRSKDAASRLLSDLAWTEKDFYSFLVDKEKKLTNKLKLLPERK